MTRIIGLIRARNEAWVIRYSAAAALQWVDELVILDHASVDHTMEIALQLADQFKGRVWVMHEADPTWREMAQLNRMLQAARDFEATHVAIIDADEVLTQPLVPQIRGMAELLESGEMLRVNWLNLWRSLDVWRDDLSKHGKQRVSLIFRDHPSLHWPAEERFNHRSPIGIVADKDWPAERGGGGVIHLQRCNWSRAVTRQRLYKLREALRGVEPLHVIDARYASALDERGAVLKPVPAAWWAHGLDRGLIDLDAEPWELGECKRLLAEHGRKRFNGLSLSC